MSHAFLSPSGAPAWTRCLVKPWRELGAPDESSPQAEEGTEAHEWLNTFFTHGVCAPQNPKQEIMFAEIRKTYDLAKELAQKSPLYSEIQLDISRITGTHAAGADRTYGTADVIITGVDELIVLDLKYGVGVMVDAPENEQLLIYGAAALEHFDLLGEMRTVRMVISQPRLGHVSQWALTVEELNARIEKIREIADRIHANENLQAVPGDKQCKFCRVKGGCKEYRDEVLKTVAGEFVDLTQKEIKLTRTIEEALVRLPNEDDHRLATCMESIDMIEEWCGALRKEVKKRLMANNFNDQRFKLVRGKRGTRKWSDPVAALKALKALRLKTEDIMTQEIISPTQTEKLLKNDPKKWEKLQQHIVQFEGQPSVVPADDPRPTISGADFTNLDGD